MGLKYTKRAMTSYEVHRFFHGLEISFFPATFFRNYFLPFSGLLYPKSHRQCRATLHQVQLSRKRLMGSERKDKLLRSLLKLAKQLEVRLTKL